MILTSTINTNRDLVTLKLRKKTSQMLRIFGLESLGETLQTVALDMCPLPPSLLHLLAVVLPPVLPLPCAHALHSVPLGIQERLSEREREEKRESERGGSERRSEPYSLGPALALALSPSPPPPLRMTSAAAMPAPASAGAARPPVRRRLGRVCNLGPAARDGRPPPPQRLGVRRAVAGRTARGRPPARSPDRPSVRPSRCYSLPRSPPLRHLHRTRD